MVYRTSGYKHYCIRPSWGTLLQTKYLLLSVILIQNALTICSKPDRSE